MSKKELKNILLIFFLWKFITYLFSNLTLFTFPLQTNFLGGGLLNYLRNPTFWGFINFDGDHYMSIARDGYLPLTYFFFPFYPLVVNVFAKLMGSGFSDYAFSGLFLSNLFLLTALMGLYKLGRIYFNERSVYYSLLIFLCFPTAFYLEAFYNESLFIALVVWSFYFAVGKRWTLSFLLCGLATATRLVGIALVPALFFEYYLFNKDKLFNIKTLFFLFLSLSGLLFYMMYLKDETGDFLAFFHNVEIFGNQRSTNIVLLPQVFYRYFFKVLPAVNFSYIPQSFTTVLEIVSAILFLLTAISVYKIGKYSLFVFYLLAYLIPPLSGSFSSFPRYVLALFPAFFIFGDYISKKSKPFRFIVFAVLLAGSFLALSLFMRGYFIS